MLLQAKQFLQNLLSDSSKISHKRLIAVGSWIMLCIMVIAKFFDAKLDNNLIYTMASLAGGYSVLSTIDKSINGEKNINTSSDNLANS